MPGAGQAERRQHAMPPSNVRALHYVVKVSDRTATVAFLKDVLGMVALR